MSSKMNLSSRMNANSSVAKDVAWTTITIIVAGSYDDVLYRKYRGPIQNQGFGT